MSALTADEAGGANVAAFLDMIAYSEIGPELLALSEDGYNVLVGSTPAHPLLFSSYGEHPRIHNAAMNSDAAGRYQFLGRYWTSYRAQLDLADFGPVSQDIWAIQLIRECHALGLVKAGQFATAVNACKSRWASWPGAGYGQHENDLAALQTAYTEAGGTVA
mgnify:CR=1 FL=1